MAAAGAALVAPLLVGGLDRLDSLEVRLLAAHNRERASESVAPLVWDEALAADAAGWARHLARTGRLSHHSGTGDDPQGENLWAGTSGHFTPEAMVGLWIAEKRDYRPGVFPANSRTGNFADVGHYTQLMWRSTTRLGCAVADGGGTEYLVCRYGAAGNVVGRRPF